MGRLKVALAAVLLIIACQTTAQAHAPYVTITQPIILPDGKPGELRFAHVDGIFWSDPIRAVIVNSEGCMIARTRSSRIMALSCNGRNCRVFDLENDEVLELEPSTFLRGAIVHPMQDGGNGEKCEDIFAGLLDVEGAGAPGKPAPSIKSSEISLSCSGSACSRSAFSSASAGSA